VKDLQHLITNYVGIQGARVFDLYFLLLMQYLRKYSSGFVYRKGSAVPVLNSKSI
jgi:hypothetical protein